MSHQNFEALELIPIDLMPNTETLHAGLNRFCLDRLDRDYSDLFPLDSYYKLSGCVLGDYLGGDPREGHPLHSAIEGLYTAYRTFSNDDWQNGFRHPEATGYGMMATKLQQHIGRCIAKGYDNIAKKAGSLNAIRTVFGYIDEQEESRVINYNEELDSHTSLLAELDQGNETLVPDEINEVITVISDQDIKVDLGEVLELPEFDRESRKEYAKEQIGIVRMRLMRLRFEYMSATALVQLLKEAV